jgi:hypothetical protein
MTVSPMVTSAAAISSVKTGSAAARGVSTLPGIASQTCSEGTLTILDQTS